MSTKRYHVYCKKIAPEARDAYREHASGFLNIYGGADEGMESARIGDLVEYSVDLDEAGRAAFELASNRIAIEPVATVTVDGFGIEPVETPKYLVGADAVTRIPADEDTVYLRAGDFREKSLTGEGVRIGIIDTGLGAAVAGWLKAQIVGTRSTVGKDPLRGGDHGTHVTCSALPDKAELVVGQGLDPATGSGSSDGILSLGYWMVDVMRCHVINMSLSSGGGADTFERFLRHARSKGTIVVCAGGNEAQSGNPRRYPGGCPSAVAVSAFDRTTDQKAPFSSYHDYIDLAASGVRTLSYLASGMLGRMSGSSMAAPLVTWTLASLMSGRQGEQVLQAVRAGARDTQAPATHEGSGVVSGEGTLGKLGAQPPEEEPVEPEPPVAEPGVFYRVISGVFKKPENARKRRKALEEAGFPAFIEKRGDA